MGARDHVPVRRGQRIDAVPDRDHRHVRDHVGHHVAVQDAGAVFRERLGPREDRLPAVGHQVAVGVPAARVRAHFILFSVRKAVAVRIARGDWIRAALVRRAGALRDHLHFLEAIRHVVAVHVRVFHDDDRAGQRVDAGLDGQRRRMIVNAQLHRRLQVAPRLVRVANAVRVEVDERHRVVAAGHEAGERGHAVVFRIEPEERGGRRRPVRQRLHARVAGEAQARRRIPGEVRVLVHAHDHLRDGRRAGAEVADVELEAGVARLERVVRIGLAVQAPATHPDVELGRIGPEAFRRLVLRVHLGDTPEVVRAVLQLFAHVDRRLPGTVVGGGQEVRAGIPDDLRKVRVLRNLQLERRHLVRSRPDKLRTGRVDVPGGGFGRTHGDRLRARRIEGACERHDVRCVRGVADQDGVRGGPDRVRSDGGLRRVLVQVLPVEVERILVHEIGFREPVAHVEIDVARPHGARIGFDAVDGRAHHPYALDAVSVDREAHAGGVVRQQDGHLGHRVPAHVHVADEAIGLARVALAVAVRVRERDEGRLALAQEAERGGVVVRQREVELLDVALRHRAALPIDPHEGTAQVKVRDFIVADRDGEIAVLELGEVNLHVAGEVVHIPVTERRAVHTFRPYRRVVIPGVGVAGVPVRRVDTEEFDVIKNCPFGFGGGVADSGAGGFFFVVPMRFMRVEERDFAMLLSHHAGTEVEAHYPVGIDAEEARTGRGRVVRPADRPRGVRLAGKRGTMPRLDDDLAVERIAHAVVGDLHPHGRNRMLRQALVLVGPGRDERKPRLEGRIGEGRGLRPVAPAVAVGIGEGVPDRAVHEGQVVGILPVVVHVVVVGEELAEIAALAVYRHGAPVVGRDAVGAGGKRIQPDAEVRVDLRNHVLGVVREPVAVVVVLAAARQAREVGVPVRQLARLHVVRERVVHRAAGRSGRDHALHEVAQIGFARRHLAPVVGDDGVPAEAVRRAVSGLRHGLPPVGDAVGVVVAERERPGVGRALAVPHLLAALRERAAQRHEVGGADDGRAQVEVVFRIHVAPDQLQVFLQLEALEMVEAVRLEEDVRIRRRRVREDDLVHAHLARRRQAAVPLAPVLRADGRAVERRQVSDGVLDPRHEAPVAVHRAADVLRRIPPAAVDVARHVVAFDLAEVPDVLREAARLERHVLRVGRARQGLEVVVHHKLGRQHGLAVVVVPRGAVRPGRVRLVALRGDVVERVALVHVVHDGVHRAGAVPHAHLVQVAGVEVAEAGPRGVLGNLVRLLVERPGAQHHGAWHGHVGVAQHREVGHLFAVRSRQGVLHEVDEAVRRDEPSRLRLHQVAVHVELQRLAVERERHVRPGVRRQRVVVRERERGLPRRAGRHGVVRVEAAVEVAVRRDADAEVRAHLRHVVRHRGRAVDGAALKDRLRAVERLGLDPGLDGELAERVVRLPVQAVEAAGA